MCNSLAIKYILSIDLKQRYMGICLLMLQCLVVQNAFEIKENTANCVIMKEDIIVFPKENS